MNWPMYAIIFVGLVIVPLWFLDFVGSFGIFSKLIMTAVLGGALWYIMEYGKGAKRGIFTK